MFSKKSKDIIEEKNYTKICALLIHAAKIDQNFSLNEENIIKQTLVEIGAKNSDLIKIISEAKKIENDSNQILYFTKEVKSMTEINKIKIVEALWRIIYSNKVADIYETSLMRSLGGLLYIDDKIMGNIKDKIRKLSQ